MLHNGLHLVELRCVDVVGDAHDERVLRRVEPRFVGEQRCRMFAAHPLRACGSSSRPRRQLVRHRRVFCIDPPPRMPRVLDLKPFFQIESVVEAARNALPARCSSTCICGRHAPAGKRRYSLSSPRVRGRRGIRARQKANTRRRAQGTSATWSLSRLSKSMSKSSIRPY